MCSPVVSMSNRFTLTSQCGFPMYRWLLIGSGQVWPINDIKGSSVQKWTIPIWWFHIRGLILGLRPANERWCYFVTALTLALRPLISLSPHLFIQNLFRLTTKKPTLCIIGLLCWETMLTRKRTCDVEHTSMSWCHHGLVVNNGISNTIVLEML